MDDLIAWKGKILRKPLYVYGSRQTGKTWVLKKFADESYRNSIYINFLESPSLRSQFTIDVNVPKLIESFEIIIGYKFNPAQTLIILDEAQEIPDIIEILNIVYMKAPQYHIVFAGTPIKNFKIENKDSIKSKVDIVNIYPLTFTEFIQAMGSEKLASFVELNDFDSINGHKEDYLDLLKYYFFVGGMPEAVLSYSKNKDLMDVQLIHKRILADYERDLVASAGGEGSIKTRAIWLNVPYQLEKENKKFIYSAIKEGARAREYDGAINWLADNMLLHKIYRISSPSAPLIDRVDAKAFKLFLNDVGLLGSLMRVKQDILLEGNYMFTRANEALTHQYVAQQLITLKKAEIYFWTNERNTSEVDFIISDGEQAIPVEPMAEINLQSKRLKAFTSKFGSHASIRLSLNEYSKEGSFTNLPLYAIAAIMYGFRGNS